MAKRTKITIETDSLLVLRGRTSLRAWCSQCGAEVKTIPLNDAGLVSNLPPASVQAWMQSAGLHQITTAGGVLLLCFDYMLKQLHKTWGGD
jgi:hypothetical protein